jgi:hypothetical protein
MYSWAQPRISTRGLGSTQIIFVASSPSQIALAASRLEYPLPISMIRAGRKCRITPLRENGEDLVTEVPGLFQIEQPVHFSAFGGSSLDPQVGQSQPLIYPMPEFGLDSHGFLSEPQWTAVSTTRSSPSGEGIFVVFR